MRMAKLSITLLSFLGLMTSSLALEVETSRGSMSFEKALSEKVAVYEVSALDTLGALGIKPAGVPDSVNVDYLQETIKDGTNVGTLFEPDMESLNQLKPEAIIIGGRMAAKYDAIKGLAPVIDMTNSGMSVSRTKDLLMSYGTLFGKSEKAQELSQRFDEELKLTKEAIKGKGKALMIMVNGQKIASFGVKSRFGYLFNDLGWEPADDNQSDARHGNPVSFEFIREMNPDWIIVMDRMNATGSKGENAKTVLDNALLKGTTAFQKNQVVYLDSSSYLASGGYQQMMRELKLLRDAVTR